MRIQVKFILSNRPTNLVDNREGIDRISARAGALLQVPRVAKARGLAESKVRTLAEEHIEPQQFGLIGQERVNVLKLNIALDELAKGKR